MEKREFVVHIDYTVAVKDNELFEKALLKALYAEEGKTLADFTEAEIQEAVANMLVVFTLEGHETESREILKKALEERDFEADVEETTEEE